MLEKIPFGQTPEQVKKAENILSGSSLELIGKEEQDPGQVYSIKSKRIKDIDEAYDFTEEKIALAKKKISGSELEDATLEDKDN